MRHHGGFILADVVGLGKTVVGVLLIKKFISEAFSLKRIPRVLIITPPSIRSNWVDTIRQFDEDSASPLHGSVDFITTGSIGKLVSNEFGALFDQDFSSADDFEIKASENYGLILIDESHNFRNNRTQKYQDLTQLIGDIENRTGDPPYIGLLSATPQNNRPNDLKNQIYLFHRTPNNSTLFTIPDGKLDTFMSEQQRLFEEYRKQGTEESRKALQKVAEEIREKVLNLLVVRRTRNSVQKYYPEDSKRLNFPDVQPPHTIEYKLGNQLSKTFSKTIDAIAYNSEEPYDKHKNIGFYRYSAIMFLESEEHKALYEVNNLTVESISSRLATIMRILLVKRLESSIHAFRESLINLRKYTQNMIDMLNADTVYVCPDIDINAEIESYGSLDFARPAIEEKMKVLGGNNRLFRASDFSEEYIIHLRNDLALITKLSDEWNQIFIDPKQEKYKASLREVLFDPKINNPSGKDEQKLVIFTEAIATLKSLAAVTENMGYKVLQVSSENRRVLEGVIRENFDANVPIKEQRNDYNVIITTEVLAEGVNLHRANVILNYDTPWNSTRLMQRIGRVNRIGSTEKEIHVFNFYPTAEGNEQIQLVELAFNKLQAFHTMFGEDNQIFSDQEELFDIEFSYDAEDTDSPLAPYVIELKAYQKEHPDRFKQIREATKFSGSVSRPDGLKPQRAWIMVRTGGRPYATMLTDINGQIKQATPLEGMEFLKCSKDALFMEPTPDLTCEEELASKIYLSMLKSFKGAKDVKGDIKKAIKVLNTVIKPELADDEADEIFNLVQSALQNGNSYVANLVIKSTSQEGINYSEWLKATFSTIAQAEQAKQDQDTEILISVVK